MKFNKLTITVLMVFTVSGLAIGATGHGSSATSHDSSNDSHKSAKKPASKAVGPAVHWEYTGNEGASHWGDLSSAYETCKAGYNQSPVDINKTVDKDLESIHFNYSPTDMKILNNGHTIQVNRNGESKISIAGKEYKLLQFHFHSPSEHTYHGKPYPMEMHLVHQGDDGRLAVVGVFIMEGSHNRSMDMVLGNVLSNVNQENVVHGLQLNPAALLPKKRDFYHYNGSLTTPPCSEGVRWFVMSEAIQVSHAQVKKFLGMVGKNARPVQPLNRRVVKK